ncbi:hypothetical protein LO80_03395 [Candidatus Francisella endociliophora]|uniref:Uncharacterized protein n=1 Tax=Candidatus Francisella endociliophora TaxID=653937 RepID=A0A097ENG6_9GAMM|nr:hypothetical protein [Francisella sp. FSC1006]AIT09104.1 hypothetical protein LO80_03395 [Francisella sp. FSC1006]
MKKLIPILLAIIIIQLSYICYKTSVNSSILYEMAKAECDNNYPNMCKFLDKKEFDDRGFVKSA